MVAFQRNKINKLGSSGERKALSTTFAGIHLSGSNATKTSVVVLDQFGDEDNVSIKKVYEKIGSYGSLFSDERLADILVGEGPFAEVFIDCPLSLPPCVSCGRQQCPGVIHCDDMGVAYMMALSSKLKQKKVKRLRPINPQNQRLWDVFQLFERTLGEEAESLYSGPTFSANMAPLVIRAKTLQRRLHALPVEIKLRETAIPYVLHDLRNYLKLPSDISLSYRNFEKGCSQRQLVLGRLQAMGWINTKSFSAPSNLKTNQDHFEMIISSVENFHAFMAAWIGALYKLGFTIPKPDHFSEEEGWVHRPMFFCHIDKDDNKTH